MTPTIETAPRALRPLRRALRQDSATLVSREQHLWADRVRQLNHAAGIRGCVLPVIVTDAEIDSCVGALVEVAS